MRLGSGLQDPAAAPGVYLQAASTHTFQPSFGCRELGVIIYIGEYKLSAEGTGLDGGCSGQCPGWSGDMRRYSA